MAEKDVTVRSATGAMKEFELDAAETLDKIRSKLGAFMKKDDFFTDKKGEPVTDEKGTKLDKILKDDTIVLRKQAAGSPGPKPEPGPGIDTGPGKDPFNSKPREVNLVPIKHPPIHWAKDYEGLETGYSGTTPVPEDKVKDLMVGQQRSLLLNNNIDLNQDKHGLTKAFVMGGELGLGWAKETAVQFDKVRVDTLNVDRRADHIVTYSEVTAQRYKAVVFDSNVGAEIPGIFSADASYRYSSATTTATMEVTVYGVFSELHPRARVSFGDDSISLSQDFVDQIKQAVGHRDLKFGARALLDCLEKYGQFVATDIMLGGRVNLSSNKILRESHKIDSVKHAFTRSAELRLKVEGVDIKAGSSTGVSYTDETRDDEVWQQSRIQLIVIGGNQAGVATKPGELVANWLNTVAKYLNWKVVGFYPKSLVPTIQYLEEPSLRFKCWRILKDYFTGSLDVAETFVGVKGDSHHNLPQEWRNPQSDGRRIRKVAVNHAKWGVIGLIVTSQKSDGSLEEVGYGKYMGSTPLKAGQVGHSRLPSSDGTFQQVGQLVMMPLGASNLNDASKVEDFVVADDDELREVEALMGDANEVIGLAFHTALGHRHPPGPHFYGCPDKQNRKVERISAPRVFELVVGWSWTWVPGGREDRITKIGLRYRELPEKLPSRSFLLAMEPYLFPMTAPYTDGGLLLAGKWAKEADLDNMDSVEKRNHLGTMAFEKFSNQPTAYWQGLSHDALLNKAAIAAFLKASEEATEEWLKSKSDTEHYKRLIRIIDARTGVPENDLRALTVPELIDWGWFVKGAARAEDARDWNKTARS